MLLFQLEVIQVILSLRIMLSGYSVISHHLEFMSIHFAADSFTEVTSSAYVIVGNIAFLVVTSFLLTFDDLKFYMIQ